ncbi:MAG: HD domain-containing protein [Solirubrobacterales bacterium]|nr:HD domain-containing protein [Solirubrobacterales bacterium]
MSLSVRGWNPTFVRLPQTQSTIEYAEGMHAGQRRADGTQFILHPLEVASLLYYAGAPDHLIAAEVLHDVVEKADVAAGELRGRFGSRLASLVLAVSDGDRIVGYGDRKAALRRQVAGADEDALTLFAADKLSKVRELHREAATDPGAGGRTGRVRNLRARRLRHYRRSLALLEERIPGSPLVSELHEELDALLRDRTLAAAV